VEQFTAHHPQAKCKDESTDTRACYQGTGVSLADARTDDSACERHKYACERQGVKAWFYRGRMKSITYRFYGAVSYRTFCDAFAAKYGRPDHDFDQEYGEVRKEAEQYGLKAPPREGLGCSWEEGKISLSAWGGKVPKHDMQATVIVLSDSTPSKDI
jgi:hypothetical protein